jgi:ribose transport system substrate-binding protein
MEIGRIQARQIGALLPNGGSMLFIQGPSDNSTVVERTAGMQQQKPNNVQITALRGQWTEQSAEKTITSWLQLATSRRGHFHLIASHNDGMAIGARKAFEAQNEPERGKWLRLPFIGIDGLPQTGQYWVRSGKLTATIVMPLTIPVAIETLTQALRTGTNPPELTLVESKSFPSIDALAPASVDTR